MSENIINYKNVIIFFCVIGVLGVLTAIVVFLSMTNKELEQLNNKSSESNKELEELNNKSIKKSKEVKLYNNRNMGGNVYGEKVSLEYDSDKKYKIINMSGHYTTQQENARIALVFSDNGIDWNLPGETDLVSTSDIDDKTNFMVQYVDVPFKFVTVYVQNPVKGFNCTIRLSN